MNNATKNFLLIVSAGFNLFLVLLFVLASSSKTESLSFHGLGPRHAAAAAVAVVPASGTVVFNPVEIAVAVGEQAALQFSVVSGRSQANRLVAAMYDRAVVDVRETGYGLLITALREGETMLQTVANEGITDVALVTVSK
jgi:hypothetical protein